MASRSAGRDDHVHVDADGRPDQVTPAAGSEVGLELVMSHSAAMAWASLAVTLRWRLSATWAALNAGTIDLYRARLIAEATSPLDDDTARAVEQLVLPSAGGQAGGQLRVALRRAVIAVDPEGAEQRRQDAQRHAKVSLYPDPADGTATLAGTRLPSVHAAAAMARLTAIARAMKSAGQAGGLDYLRAMAFIGLLLGTLPLVPPPAGDPGPPGPTDPGPPGPTDPDPGPPGPADPDPGPQSGDHDDPDRGPGGAGPADPPDSGGADAPRDLRPDDPEPDGASPSGPAPPGDLRGTPDDRRDPGPGHPSPPNHPPPRDPPLPAVTRRRLPASPAGRHREACWTWSSPGAPSTATPPGPPPSAASARSRPARRSRSPSPPPPTRTPAGRSSSPTPMATPLPPRPSPAHAPAAPAARPE